MDAETKKEFEDLAVMIGNGFAKVDEQFEDIRSKMATKDDLAMVESRLDAKIDSVESRLDARIDSVESGLAGLGVKIDAVRGDVEDVKVAVAKLDARDKADTDALVGDVLELRQKVEAGTRP